MTCLLVFAFTRRWKLSLNVGALEFLTKCLAYYLHERAWFLIPWGKGEAPPHG